MPDLQCEGVTLHYQWIDGREGLPLLVFLHEGLGCTAMWKNFPQALCRATGCPGLVYDREGYGLSSPLTAPRTLRYLHHAAGVELPKVLRRLAPRRPYVLIGHSDGGSIGLIHAAAAPPDLRGVATMAAHVFVEEVTLAGIRSAQQAFDAGKLRALARYHGDKVGQVFHAWSDTWLAPEFRRWRIDDLLPAATCPVLALQGSDDQYGTPAQLDAIAGAAPHARQCLIPACGHSPHLEQPQATLQALAEFINRLAP